jgi:hypothetical protein
VLQRRWRRPHLHRDPERDRRSPGASNRGKPKRKFRDGPLGTKRSSDAGHTVCAGHTRDWDRLPWTADDRCCPLGHPPGVLQVAVMSTSLSGVPGGCVQAAAARWPAHRCRDSDRGCPLGPELVRPMWQWVARSARTTMARTWRNGSQLGRRVRPARGHHCLVGKPRRQRGSQLPAGL